MLSCCREEQCLGQGPGKGSSAADSNICCNICQGCKSVVLECWLLMSVYSRFQGPAWILFMCWYYPLGGKRVNMNAEFGQAGRPLGQCRSLFYSVSCWIPGGEVSVWFMCTRWAVTSSGPFPLCWIYPPTDIV